MLRNFKLALLALVSASTIAGPATVMAAEPTRPSAEPSWTYGVVRVGEDRDAIKSLPITNDPIDHCTFMAIRFDECIIGVPQSQPHETS